MQLEQATEMVGLIAKAMDIADNFGNIEDEEADVILDFLYEKLGDAAFYATRLMCLLKKNAKDILSE